MGHLWAGGSGPMSRLWATHKLGVLPMGRLYGLPVGWGCWPSGSPIGRQSVTHGFLLLIHDPWIARGFGALAHRLPSTGSWLPMGHPWVWSAGPWVTRGSFMGRP